MPVSDAPKLTAATESMLDAAGEFRPLLTAALWPSAPDVAAKIETTPAAVRAVPAPWVRHVLVLCSPSAITAAAGADKRVATTTAARALVGDLPARPRVTRPPTPTQAIAAWRRAARVDAAEAALDKLVAAQVADDDEVWSEVHAFLFDHPEDGGLPDLRYPRAQNEQVRLFFHLPPTQQSWVLARATAWSTWHLAALGRLPCAQTVTLLTTQPRPLAPTARAALASVGAQRLHLTPAVLALAALLGGEEVVGSWRDAIARYSSPEAAVAAVAAYRHVHAVAPDAAQALLVVLDTAPMAYSLSSSCADPGELAQVFAAVGADRQRRLALASICDGEAIDVWLSVGSDDELAEWAAHAHPYQIRAVTERTNTELSLQAVDLLLAHRPGLLHEMMASWWRPSPVVVRRVLRAVHDRVGDRPEAWRVALELADESTVYDAAAAAAAVLD